MADKLKNKVAVITGGTTGIGFATAKRFIDEGATVVLTGTNPKSLEAARAELDGQADVVTSDASREKDVRELFEHVVNKHGKNRRIIPERWDRAVFAVGTAQRRRLRPPVRD